MLNKRQPGDSPRTTKQFEAVLHFLMITLIHTYMLVYSTEKFEIILLEIRNMQSTESVVISKLTVLSECKSTTQNVQPIQFHRHQLSEYFRTLEIFTLQCAII